MAVLTDGLGLSRWNVLEEVVANEFSHEIGDAAREAFMERVLPEVDEVFAIYDLSDGGFSQSKEYDDLYNELTGAVGRTRCLHGCLRAERRRHRRDGI